jgi:hypothetical protein
MGVGAARVRGLASQPTGCAHPLIVIKPNKTSHMPATIRGLVVARRDLAWWLLCIEGIGGWLRASWHAGHRGGRGPSPRQLPGKLTTSPSAPHGRISYAIAHALYPNPSPNTRAGSSAKGQNAHQGRGYTRARLVRVTRPGEPVVQRLLVNEQRRTHHEDEDAHQGRRGTRPRLMGVTRPR